MRSHHAPSMFHSPKGECEGTSFDPRIKGSIFPPYRSIKQAAPRSQTGESGAVGEKYGTPPDYDVIARIAPHGFPRSGLSAFKVPEINDRGPSGQSKRATPAMRDANAGAVGEGHVKGLP
jgi:hypothetical protein